MFYDGSWGESFFKAKTDSMEINGRIYHCQGGMRSVGVMRGSQRVY